MRIEPPRLNDTQVAECTNFIKEAIELPFEDYLEIFHQKIGYFGKMIYNFFTLPKTSLHEEFREKVSRPHRMIRVKKEEEVRSRILAENAQNAISDPKFEKEVEKDIKYKIISKLNTDRGGILTIGIPYEKIEIGKGYQTKFAYTSCIMEYDMPNLYKKILDSMSRIGK